MRFENYHPQHNRIQPAGKSIEIMNQVPRLTYFANHCGLASDWCLEPNLRHHAVRSIK